MQTLPTSSSHSSMWVNMGYCDSSIQALQLAQETEKYQQDMDRIRQTNAELNRKIREVEAENKNLELGLKEVLQSVKDSNSTRSAGMWQVSADCRN